LLFLGGVDCNKGNKEKDGKYECEGDTPGMAIRQNHQGLLPFFRDCLPTSVSLAEILRRSMQKKKDFRNARS
jgi:hypothetical protein